MTTTTEIITLDGLKKHFGDTHALEHLTAEIRGGYVTGLVGPDGAGKTTLLRMLAGLLTPTSGDLSVIGIDPITEQNHLKTVIGYMPQRFGLYEDLSVMQNLNLYADLRGITGNEREQQFKQLLKFTDLARFTDRLAGKLSGGMKQKLGLACTLLGNPQVLLLDEPGVGVDPISRRELWQMVHTLADEGRIIIWSTSYLDEAEQCQEILLLNEGKLLFNGQPNKLTERVNGRSFLIETRERSHRKLLQQALAVEGVKDGVIQGKFLRLIFDEKHQPQEIMQQLAISQYQVFPAVPCFEDAFIDLLGGTDIKTSELAKIITPIPPNPNESVIEAKNLTKKFGSFTATDRVNFAVKRGEIFGLLGPNGAGKSTTFKMMCGLLIPSDGDALVLGIDLKTSSHQARQHLGYMAQKFSLYGNLTLQQNLNFFSGVYGLKGKEQQKSINEMIHAFNFTPILKKAPDTLPLGYKQRLALACALMHKPDILFLDEPTSGVDPITRREFWLHINGMVEKGVTVMVTTHFMDEAEYCDRIGLVYRGKLIALGTPDELKKQVVTDQNPNPSMEDAFIELVQHYDLGEHPNE